MQAQRLRSRRFIGWQFLGAPHIASDTSIVLSLPTPRPQRMAISIGVPMLVGAELTVTSGGVAWLALRAAAYLDGYRSGRRVDQGALGYGLDRIVRALEGHLVRVAARISHWIFGRPSRDRYQVRRSRLALNVGEALQIHALAGPSASRACVSDHMHLHSRSLTMERRVIASRNRQLVQLHAMSDGLVRAGGEHGIPRGCRHRRYVCGLLRPRRGDR